MYIDFVFLRVGGIDGIFKFVDVVIVMNDVKIIFFLIRILCVQFLIKSLTVKALMLPESV